MQSASCQALHRAVRGLCAMTRSTLGHDLPLLRGNAGALLNLLLLDLLGLRVHPCGNFDALPLDVMLLNLLGDIASMLGLRGHLDLLLDFSGSGCVRPRSR